MATYTITFQFNVDPDDVATWQNRMVGTININAPCILRGIEFVGHNPADGQLAWLGLLAPTLTDVSVPSATQLDADPTTNAVVAFSDALPNAILYAETYSQIWPNFGATGVVGYVRGLDTGQSISIKIEAAPCAETGVRSMIFTFDV